MALESICGMDKVPFMKSFGYRTSKQTIEEIRVASSNMDNPLAIMAPPYENPRESVKKLNALSEVQIDFDHGTTTVGFVYQGGIILCVDSRATSGKLIGSQSIHKVVQVNQYIMGTTAGGAADCTYWDRALTRSADCTSSAIRSDFQSNLLPNISPTWLRNTREWVSAWE